MIGRMSRALLVPLLLCVLAPLQVFSAAPADFTRWFVDGTIRIDLAHRGDAEAGSFELLAIYEEGAWAGRREKLAEPDSLGKYRFSVRDLATGTVLFEGGYSSLFGEWQTTEEAKKRKREFVEVVRFPKPRASFILAISERGPDGGFKDVFTSAKLAPEMAGPAARPSAKTLDLHISESPDRALDIVFIGDGYDAGNQDKLERDLSWFARVLLRVPPFDRYKARISIRAVMPVSRDNGPDEPGRKIFNQSALECSFSTFGSARYLTPGNERKLRDLAGLVPYDTVIVIVNTPRYGGAGIYNAWAVAASDSEYNEYLMAHEFGHSFAGLADEYYSSAVSYSDFYPKGVEPPEPNITALIGGREQLKWKAFVRDDIPVPTPVGKGWDSEVGVFEGAGYAAKGLFRPMVDCKMFSKKNRDYCPVCMKAVEDMIKSHTGEME